MLFITSDQELSLSRSNTLQDAVIIIVGCHNGNPLCGCNQIGNGTDRIDPNVRLLFSEAEFLSQNTVELGQDERGDEKLGFSSLQPHPPPFSFPAPVLGGRSFSEVSASVGPQGTGARLPGVVRSWFGFPP